MSILPSDLGNTTGVLSQQYTKYGSIPTSGTGVLVLLQIQNMAMSPYCPFRVPSSDELVQTLGANAPPDVDSLFNEINAVLSQCETILGPQGCFDDRICYVFPPWVCFLPVICCFGGFCLVTRRSKHHILDMTSKLNAILALKSAGSNVTWTLCCGSHEVKLDMTEIHMQQGRVGEGGSRTIAKTYVWLEARPTSYYSAAKESAVECPIMS